MADDVKLFSAYREFVDVVKGEYGGADAKEVAAWVEALEGKLEGTSVLLWHTQGAGGRAMAWPRLTRSGSMIATCKAQLAAVREAIRAPAGQQDPRPLHIAVVATDKVVVTGVGVVVVKGVPTGNGGPENTRKHFRAAAAAYEALVTRAIEENERKIVVHCCRDTVEVRHGAVVLNDEEEQRLVDETPLDEELMQGYAYLMTQD